MVASMAAGQVGVKMGMAGWVKEMPAGALVVGCMGRVEKDLATLVEGMPVE